MTKVKQLMREKGINIYDLAVGSQISINTLHYYCTGGRQRPPQYIINEVSRILEESLTSDDFLKFDLLASSNS